jgi:ABC-type uncharacterized transport system involved in gliding motility auxiliary subunit
MHAGSAHLWRHRGRRFAAGLNVCVSIVLATALAGMAVALANRFHARADWSARGYYTLSDKTQALIASLDDTVRVVSLFRRDQPLYEHIRNLLEVYADEARRTADGRVRVELIDPDRDLARTRELVESYGVRDENVIVFESAGRRCIVEADDLVDVGLDFDGLLTTGRARRRLLGYRGEQAFTSAIQSVSEAAHPIVYLLAGHGERDPEAYGDPGGYAAIVRAMRRDTMIVRPLLLAERGGVPDDASALIVAGPKTRLAVAEAALIDAYLNRGGRVLFLLDADSVSGLERLLEGWGVVLRRDIVVDPRRTLTGRDVFVTRFDDHPVTRRLQGSAVVFVTPRSVRPAEGFGAGAAESADRPRVATLAACGPDGWAEVNLDESPVRYDAGLDTPGPVSVAVAVERGGVSGVDLGLRPTRLVVIGDSGFVSNGALDGSVGGNRDFILGALNWLVDRETLVAIEPRPPFDLNLNMDRDRMRFAFIVLTLGVPALVGLAGCGVALSRRHP